MVDPDEYQRRVAAAVMQAIFDAAMVDEDRYRTRHGHMDSEAKYQRPENGKQVDNHLMQRVPYPSLI